MFWCVFTSILFLITITLLYAPFKLLIQSKNNQYLLSWAGVLKASASTLENDIDLQLTLFGWGKKTTLIELLAAPKTKKKKPFKKKINRSFSKVSWNTIVEVLNSFRVKQFFINIDYHSVYWNAWLYPLGEIFRTENVELQSNFEGKTELNIEIINRPIWVFWALIKSNLNKKDYAKT